MLDFFPRRLHLRLPSGKDKYESGVGMCFSVLFIVLLSGLFINHVLFESQHREFNREDDLEVAKGEEGAGDAKNRSGFEA